jgi:hypothetical protein
MRCDAMRCAMQAYIQHARARLGAPIEAMRKAIVLSELNARLVFSGDYFRREPPRLLCRMEHGKTRKRLARDVYSEM